MCNFYASIRHRGESSNFITFFLLFYCGYLKSWEIKTKNCVIIRFLVYHWGALKYGQLAKMQNIAIKLIIQSPHGFQSFHELSPDPFHNDEKFICSPLELHSTAFEASQCNTIECQCLLLRKSTRKIHLNNKNNKCLPFLHRGFCLHFVFYTKIKINIWLWNDINYFLFMNCQHWG